jgi:hypothetical protein
MPSRLPLARLPRTCPCQGSISARRTVLAAGAFRPPWQENKHSDSVCVSFHTLGLSLSRWCNRSRCLLSAPKRINRCSHLSDQALVSPSEPLVECGLGIVRRHITPLWPAGPRAATGLHGRLWPQGEGQAGPRRRNSGDDIYCRQVFSRPSRAPSVREGAPSTGQMSACGSHPACKMQLQDMHSASALRSV